MFRGDLANPVKMLVSVAFVDLSDSVVDVDACKEHVDEWLRDIVCAQWYWSPLLVSYNVVADVVVELVLVEDNVDVVCCVVGVDVSTAVVVA